jgi:hypothetical protein
LEDDLCTITKYDSFDLPRGIELFEQDDLPYNEPMINEGMIPLFDENPSDENPSDENASDENPSDDNVRSEENASDENWTRIEKIQRSLDAKEDVPPIPDTVGLNPEELDMEEEQEILEKLVTPKRDQMKEDLTQLLQTSDGSQLPADESASDADKEEEEPEGFRNINLRKGKKQVRIQLPPSRKKRPLPSS